MFKLKDEIELLEIEIKERSNKTFIDETILCGLKTELYASRKKQKEMAKFREDMKENNKRLDASMDKINQENLNN